jgi:hypothetical protein
MVEPFEPVRIRVREYCLKEPTHITWRILTSAFLRKAKAERTRPHPHTTRYRSHVEITSWMWHRIQRSSLRRPQILWWQYGLSKQEKLHCGKKHKMHSWKYQNPEMAWLHLNSRMIHDPHWDKEISILSSWWFRLFFDIPNASKRESRSGTKADSKCECKQVSSYRHLSQAFYRNLSLLSLDYTLLSLYYHYIITLSPFDSQDPHISPFLSNPASPSLYLALVGAEPPQLRV